MIGGWITGALLTAGINAWYLLKNMYENYANVARNVELNIKIENKGGKNG